MDLKIDNGARVAVVAIGKVIGGYSYFITFTDDLSRNRKVFVAKRAVFLEKEHILGENSGSEIELSEVGEPSSSTILESEFVQDVDPQTYEEAIMTIDSGKWQKAMNSEMNFMYFNKVWNLVDAPEGIVSIGCKWIFKKNIGMDEKVETYKARLVAKGYYQRQWVDYDEIFSPVAMLRSIRILLAIVEH
ncbi:hypothetical protein OPV22_032528 [Ensete ventricosum]|uniref:Reverse transcriptase Ty1/copia-type domain-containing protein n=1 Tax=Ensete ventricosum TaxID=4639 RepID=A0AAV8PN14_ENSVE|nr:hypothetical protein OPV22_032528 [Ensete ventricosum]